MLLLALTPTRAEVLRPKLPCRVFVDTDYTQIPGQCGRCGAYTLTNYSR
jgi:hypothetical protein